MAKVIHYYAHPGHRHSHTNKAMWQAATQIPDITHVDLYAEYPRHQIDIDKEQQRLMDHDVIIMQFPLFWYSSPSLVKEWIDLTLERGFAFGEGGDKLKDKVFALAVSTAGSQDAYAPDGYQRLPLRTYLVPFEQTAWLTQMRFLAPYVQHSALQTNPKDHSDGFSKLITALRDDRLDLDAASRAEILTHTTLPIKEA